MIFNLFSVSLATPSTQRKKMVLKKQEYEREIVHLKARSHGGMAGASTSVAGPSSSKRRIASDDDETDSNATDDEAPPAPKKNKPVAIEILSDSDNDAEEDDVPIVGRSKPIRPKRLEILGMPPQHEPTTSL